MATACRLSPAAASRPVRTGVCVALVQEGVALRQAGIAAPDPRGARPTAGGATRRARPLAAGRHCLHPGLPRRAGGRGPGTPAAPRSPLHVKVDTGMHRVGGQPGRRAPTSCVRRWPPTPELRWVGLWTHLARADEPQGAGHDGAARASRPRWSRTWSRRATHPRSSTPPTPPAAWRGPTPGATSCDLGSRSTASSPVPVLPRCAPSSEPALSLKAEGEARVGRVASGEGISYGHRTVLDRDATVATVPLGYADGVPRRLSAVGGEVLLGGRRRPIAGVVTMDQLMVDCGDDAVEVGDEVVLIGQAGCRADPGRRLGVGPSARSTTRSSAGWGRRLPRAVPATTPTPAGVKPAGSGRILWPQ